MQGHAVMIDCRDLSTQAVHIPDGTAGARARVRFISRVVRARVRVRVFNFFSWRRRRWVRVRVREGLLEH